MWLTILIIAIIIGAVIGFLGSEDGERKSGAVGGALAGGMGCGYILFQIFLAGIGILLLIWIFGALFG
ncbi:MAG: hypothetical protein IJ640_12010 [Prevotella sp.]|nr:hypothetical protein [Prevotella sp.]MDY6230371.1 hypothetical protein [Prevotella sp.]